MNDIVNRQGFFKNEDKQMFIKVTQDKIILNIYTTDQEQKSNIQRSDIIVSESFVKILPYCITFAVSYDPTNNEFKKFEYNKKKDCWTVSANVNLNSNGLSVNQKTENFIKIYNSDIEKWTFKRTS